MKLTKQHLAAYLPYRVMVEFTYQPKNKHQDVIIEREVLDYSNIHLAEKLQAKLILHPIESITKEIEWNGKMKVPFDVINRIKECATLYSHEYMIKHPLQLPYDVVQILLSMHIDVFNLIPNNLAL